MIKRYTLILMLSLPIQANAYVLPVADFLNLPQNVGTFIETTVSSVSDLVREASGKLREAYQLVIKAESVQTTINTYKSFLEAVKIYQKTVHMIDLVTGIEGFADALYVAGDRDIRETMGKDWEYMVDEANGVVGSYTGTNRRFQRAFRDFERGNVPYNPNLIYVDRRLDWQKEIAQKRYNENKVMNVEADTAIASFSDSVEKIEKMEEIASTADVTKTRDEFRNAMQIASFQQGAERNRLLSLQLKQKALEIQEQRHRRIRDVEMAMKPLDLR